jgi:hypothetical protein
LRMSASEDQVGKKGEQELRESKDEGEGWLQFILGILCIGGRLFALGITLRRGGEYI